MPVWVVIRLCTNVDEVGDYWSNVDRILELNMDVLDDHVGEAVQIYSMNKWLTYGEPLHRMREFGIATVKEVDLLDELPLNADQMRVVLGLLFNVRPADIPHPQMNFEHFVSVVEGLNQREGDVYNPIKKKLTPWVDMTMLKKQFGPKATMREKVGGCSIA